MKRGLIQALGVTLYCSLVGTFMWNIDEVFGPGKPPFFGPIAFLMLFSASALICGLIVFYEPYKLFFAGKKKEALDIVVSNTAFLAMFAVLLLILLIFFK